MAVQVQVKGTDNNLDLVLVGAEARPERVLFGEKEMLVITDVDNKPLYLVPMSNVRFILPVSATEFPIPRHVGADAKLMVHIEGDAEGDFNLVCNRIDYKKPLTDLMANLMNVSGDGKEIALTAVVPFENIRYIDANHLEVASVPTVPVTETAEEKVVDEKPSTPVFKHKPLKN